jgi:hypothetical protein
MRTEQLERREETTSSILKNTPVLVTPEKNTRLVRSISYEEFSYTVKYLPTNKAPTPMVSS